MRPLPKHDAEIFPKATTDGYISDESSFYGDENQIATLEEQESYFSVRHYWKSIHPKSLATIAAQQRIQDTNMDADMMDVDTKEELEGTGNETSINYHNQTPTPHSPHRSKTETIPQFLARLPPRTTSASSIGPWIYIKNPAICNPVPYSNEDISNFTNRGGELLQAFNDTRAALRAEFHDRPQHLLEQRISMLRRILDADILEAARANKIITGKWMLFPSVGRVNMVWGIVAESTVHGQLGTGAKVATEGGGSKSGSANRPRVICVYTANFDDKADITRVLVKMKQLGLFRNGQGWAQIYYKCDAYTYLGVMNNNSFGLNQNMYSSMEILNKELVE
ncbi:hypothetical protein ACJ73_04467 [Blastomyces percursus]|uniref:DUF1917 domain-containing protein n=1 Tax=Blastomyces percursus TaxID=1658174 RepID=A0A1J9Q6J6_9EURO|nr:hypothetical protein ACJ73_04467 [Blastomyces percursus]